MTLIAGWRCVDGIVLHADTQETDGGLRRTVQKIRPEQIGAFQFSVAGAGNPALIESFLVLLERDLQTHAEALTLADFVERFEDVLATFYIDDIPLCTDPDKSFFLIVGVSVPESKEYDLFVTEHLRLRRIRECELIGWESAFYAGYAKRFYFPDITIRKAILAGLIVFSFAEETSNTIRSPITVAVVDSTGIHVRPSATVEELARKLKDQETRINKSYLDLAD